MRKLHFSAGQIAEFIGDKRDRKLFIARVRAMHENGLIVPESKTEGGHLRFDRKALALAAVYSHLFDMGLSIGRSTEGMDANPFNATQAALWIGKPGATAIERAMTEVPQGQFWALRIDFMHDAERGTTRWIASAYRMDNPKDSPSPKIPTRKGENAVSSILVTLNPIVLPLVADRSGTH